MKPNSKKRNLLPWIALGLSITAGCSSVKTVETQAYAKLSHQRTYEYDFSAVWKGIESTLRNYRITDRDPNEVDALEMKKIKKRKLETDWVYGQSRDKYSEYKINGTPRRVNLQTRIKYFIEAQRVLGGITVTIKPKEEVERLNEDGTSAGYESVDETDTSRSAELLDKIQNSILSAPPSNEL